MSKGEEVAPGAGAIRTGSLEYLLRESTDYFEVSRRLYANQGIDEIVDRAKEQWSG